MATAAAAVPVARRNLRRVEGVVWRALMVATNVTSHSAVATIERSA
jgi:hypothetical protein